MPCNTFMVAIQKTLARTQITSGRTYWFLIAAILHFCLQSKAMQSKNSNYRPLQPFENATVFFTVNVLNSFSVYPKFMGLYISQWDTLDCWVDTPSSPSVIMPEKSNRLHSPFTVPWVLCFMLRRETTAQLAIVCIMFEASSHCCCGVHSPSWIRPMGILAKAQRSLIFFPIPPGLYDSGWAINYYNYLA